MYFKFIIAYLLLPLAMGFVPKRFTHVQNKFADTRLYSSSQSAIHPLQKNSVAFFVSLSLATCALISQPINTLAVIDDATTSNVEVVNIPLFTKRTNELQAYSDVGRGFKLLRPFGYNEFDGAGAGYAVKFASLFNVDDNVVIGSVPATAGKTNIVDYGSVNELGEKLAKKRGGTLISSRLRNTDGITFADFEFHNPLDPSLPRTGPKNKRPTYGVELYTLCVHKGRLWSVQATSNDVSFPKQEETFRNSVASFIPKL